MPRILVINPNSSAACGAGIDAAVAPLRTPGGPAIDVLSVPDGPPAILSWRDWHAAVEPMCRLAEREAADAVVIACASDPGLEAMRAALNCPVLGVFRCAVAVATTSADKSEDREHRGQTATSARRWSWVSQTVRPSL